MAGSQTWLLTGGCGFIGSNLVRMLLAERPELNLVNVDALTYAGNTANLEGLPEDQAARHTLVRADIADPEAMGKVFAEHKPSLILHLAAESQSGYHRIYPG